MEKFGFIYVWMDRKEKKFYVGRHWGTENDGYVCSSIWMKRAYKRRPEDFKRRIVFRTTDRNLLVEEETRWLSMIKEEKLRKKYYNLIIHNSPDLYAGKEGLKLAEKVARATKEAMERPDVKKRQKLGTRLRTRKYHSRKSMMTPQELQKLSEKRREINLKWWEVRSPKHLRKKIMKRNSPELIETYRKKTQELWANRSEDEKEHVIEKMSIGLHNFYNSEDGQKRKENIREKVSEIWNSRTPEEIENITNKMRAKISDPKHKHQKLKRMAERKGFYWGLTLNDEISYSGYSLGEVSRKSGIDVGSLNLWAKQERLQGTSRRGQKYLLQKVLMK